MTETPAMDAENETLARTCEAVADAATLGMEWVGLAAAQVREEGPALARELRRGAVRARKLAEAARRPAKPGAATWGNPSFGAAGTSWRRSSAFYSSRRVCEKISLRSDSNPGCRRR